MTAVGVGDIDGHHRVGEDEAVVADHDGAVDLLGDPVGLDDRVDDLLVVAAVDLDPARVALGDGVLLVVEDGPGGADAAVDAAHDDGEPGARRPVELFVHVQKTVGAVEVKTRAPTVEAEMQTVMSRVFALHPDVFRLEFARLTQYAIRFGHGGRGGDRVGGDDLDLAELCRPGRGRVSGHDLDVTHSFVLLVSPS